MLNRVGRAAVVAVLALAAGAGRPGMAAAQGTRPAETEPALARLSVGFGAGVALPFHSDFDFTPATWDVSARIGASPHLLVEAAYSEWRRTESFEASRVGRLTQETRLAVGLGQVNLLGRVTSGPVELFGGGGGGVLLLTRRFRQTLSECTSAAEGDCRDSDNRFTSSSLTAQLVGGADVRLTRRLSAFGQLRFATPIGDIGAADIRLVAGVRVGLL